MEAYVLDTHALWWYLTDSKVSNTVKELFTRIEQGDIKFILPWICLAELYWVMKKFNKESEYWATVLDINSDKRFQHDKLIVQVAKELDIPLVTKDRLIQASSYVHIIWN